jgi:hypothetical protein
MKKGMLVIAIFVTLSVLVSMIAAAQLFAVEATNTGPTPKQVPTQKTPPASQFSKNKVVVHTKFWTVEDIQCDISYGTAGSFKPCGVVDPPASIKLGKISGSCNYKIKTLPVNEITEADAGKWGASGNKYYISAHLSHDGSPTNLVKGEFKYVPHFTWAEVKQWQSSGQGNAPKSFSGHLEFEFQLTEAFIGLNTFWFFVGITNTDNKCTGKIVFY